MLLEYGADPEQKSADGSLDAWKVAVEKGHEHVLTVLLKDAERRGNIITLRQLDIETLEHPHILRLLLAHGFDLNEDSTNKDRTIGQVLLKHAVCVSWNTCMMETLVEAGVAIHDDDPMWDVVYLARSLRHRKMHDYLLGKGGEDRHAVEALEGFEKVMGEVGRRVTDERNQEIEEMFAQLGRY